MSGLPVAWLFPGQATEESGMGRGLFEHAEARALLDRASERAGADLRRVLRVGGAALDRTEVMQPLIATLGLAAMGALERAGARPDLTAGHSLGELVAWCAAGGLDPGGAVDIAAERGRLMAAAAREHPGGLLALTGMSGFEPARLEELEELVEGRPHLAMAAYNAPTELVVSGTLEALDEVRAAFGGRIIQRLGPWHHPVMSGCVEPLRAMLEQHRPEGLRAGFVANRNGKILSRIEEGPSHIASQLVRPVRWSEVLRTLYDRGVRTFVAVGLERTLRGLVRLNGLPGARVLPAVDARSIERVARDAPGA